MKTRIKRKYEEKLLTGIKKRSDLLIGNLENEWNKIQRHIDRREKIEKIAELTKRSGIFLGKTILGLALVGGFITVSAVAPNVFAAVGRLNKKSNKRHKGFFNKEEFKKSVRYLKRQKYIKVIKKDNNNFAIYLEKKGEKRTLLETFNDLTISKPEKWDKIWRIVIFDIPERHRWGRDGFREKLNQLNFYQIQKSAFIYPYDCRKEIEFLCYVFNINDYVRFIEAKSINYDDDIIGVYKL